MVNPCKYELLNSQCSNPDIHLIDGCHPGDVILMNLLLFGL